MISCHWERGYLLIAGESSRENIRVNAIFAHPGVVQDYEKFELALNLANTALPIPEVHRLLDIFIGGTTSRTLQ